MSKKIPFIDLQIGTKKIRKEVDKAIGHVLDNTAFILGPELEAFESDFATYCEASHCVGVHSGTAALHLALVSYGIGRGDEVITVPNTFIATVEAIVMAGAKPVLVDVRPDDALIDVSLLSAAITPKTKAIIPVHLFGQPCDMDPIMDLAKKHGIVVIEDSLGHAAAFSVYPSKNLGAFGEGGAITTGDPRVFERARALRHHAQFKRNVHQEMGYNYRLDSIQAAILRVKLGYLDEYNEKRRSAAKRYIDNLKGSRYWLPIESEDRRHVYHVFPVGCPDKKAVTTALTDANIGWGEHYPVPVHLQPAFSYLGKAAGSYPVAEKLMRESVSLPMFPELEPDDIDRVCEVLKGVDGKS
jgi:dTDP-4-amino-4,6-dideoxygalactose transaminase